MDVGGFLAKILAGVTVEVLKRWMTVRRERRERRRDRQRPPADEE